jgi:sigma-E factor negative regulatory protein RseB
MKIILISVLTLFSLIQSQASAEEHSAEALLLQMNQASQQLNYELSYILIKKNSIEPLVFRHASVSGHRLAHLVYLSGPVREVIRRGEVVSYIEPGMEPFSIQSGQMIAPLIPLLNSDIKTLSQYYDFVLMGRSREAGSASQVVRVVPKDGTRYSYMLWVDEKSSLPLRADLVDRDGEVLEQYRTVSYSVNEKIAEYMSRLNDVELPGVITLPESKTTVSSWRVGWIPDGFKPHNLHRYKMLKIEKLVESQMYSDGLFNFSVYVSERDSTSLQGHLVRQGRRTLQSYVKGNKEITVVGDIPPETAKHIAQSVVFNSGTVKQKALSSKGEQPVTDEGTQP